MHNIILCAALLILGSVSASAQFYTITKETEIRPEKKQKVAPDTLQRGLVAFESCKKAENDSIETTSPTKGCKGQSDQKSYNKTSPKLEPTKEVRLETKTLPTLTIPNLLSGNHPQWHPASEDSTGTSHTGNRLVPFTTLPKPTQSVRTDEPKNREVL